jgi:hypothetical protein
MNDIMNEFSFEKVSFSGHESFPLRFSWLKKGYDALVRDPSFFGTLDAMVVLGTGKNMVRAIRHWGITCKMWEEAEHTRGRELRPTEIGQNLLEDDGWDPYLEDTGTIWLLHWLLATNQQRATTWAWLFSRTKGNLFGKEELIGELESLTKEWGKKVRRSSIKKDVDVLIRSYAREKATKGVVLEDSLDSPFVILGLMRPSLDKGHFEIVEGPHVSLPARIFKAALADYCTNIRYGGDGAVGLDELRYRPFSPGRVFRLSEQALLAYLEEIVRAGRGHYIFDETAGIRQLLLPAKLPNMTKILDDHYRRK